MTTSRLLLVILAGCGSTTFEGAVADHRGQPLEGALVTVVGNLCQARTDGSGGFALGCNSAKGEVTVSAGMEGFVSAERTLSVTSGEAHSLGSLELVGIPTGDALLFVRDGGDDHVPEVGHIVKRVEGRDEAESSFCLVEGTPTHTLSNGTLVLFDKGHEGWRLWRVGEDGCVYKKQRVDRGKWERTFGDKLATDVRELGGQLKLHQIDLEPGRYWVGEWANGFFAPDTTKEGPVHYRGHLIAVP